MRDFLARRWFLLLLAASVGLALLWPQPLRPWVDRLPTRGVVSLSLFLIAWTLPGSRLVTALLRPAGALWALTVSYGLLPLLACLLGPLLPLPDLGLGLLLCASVPCTLSSAVLWTRLAGGNEATALLAVILSTGSSFLVTTAWLTLSTGVTVVPAPTKLMTDLFLVLVVPVGLGQLSRLLPGVVRLVTRLHQANGIAVRVLVCVVILKALVTVVPELAALTLPALLLVGLVSVGLHLTGAFGGLWGGRLLGLERGDYLAAAFAGSQKTLPVGLYLFQEYYQAHYPLALTPLVFYHVSQLILDTFIAEACAPRQQPPPPDAIQ